MKMTIVNDKRRNVSRTHKRLTKCGPLMSGVPTAPSAEISIIERSIEAWRGGSMGAVAKRRRLLKESVFRRCARSNAAIKIGSQSQQRGKRINSRQRPRPHQ